MTNQIDASSGWGSVGKRTDARVTAVLSWIASIEFVQDHANLGADEGGYDEDHEFFGYRVPI